MERSVRRVAVAAALLALVVGVPIVHAQEPPSDPATPAFTLSTSETFTTKDSPSLNLTFRHVTALDFRVYRVNDPFAFFASLRDPHQMGSEERLVPQERSWIERLAEWKARQRRTMRTFLRDQVTHEYRVARTAATDRAQVAQRVALNQRSFAQVPLLNPQQLVTSWRELLPDRRDPEYRRVPLEVRDPGLYLVEAVSGLLRAYTIVVVSDVGLVTKAAPGQVLTFAADRTTGEPRPGCEIQVFADREVAGRGVTGADGVFTAPLPSAKPDHLVSLARCGNQVAVTDPGGYYTSEPVRQLIGYVYTDKPIYRPGHSVHLKAVLRWRQRDALVPFDRSTAEIAVADVNDKVVFRRALTPDDFGAVHASFPLPATAALGAYAVRVISQEEEATGSFEVQEYRRPEFEVIVTPTERFVVQGNTAVASVQARYYFGQPVGNARVRYVVNRQAYYSPHRWSDTGEESDGSSYWYGGDQTATGELRLDAEGRGQIRVPLAEDENGRDYSARIEAQVTDASSREVAGNSVVHATYGSFLVTTQVSGYVFRPAQTISTSIRAVDYAGTPRADVPIAVSLERVTYPEGRYAEPVRTAVADGETTTAADGTASVTLTLGTQPGTYVVRATATAAEREIHSESWVWVAGPEEAANVEGERYLELVSDKRSYQPGDTARLVLRGESFAGPMLVTKEGQHVAWHTLLRPGSGEPLEVPVTAEDIGDIYVHVAFLRDGRLYRAERRLAVPATQQTLHITLTADRPVAKPQDPGVFTVAVADAAGAPVRAQVSLGVIDEAVYAIRADDTPDPVRFFYRREYSRVGTSFSRDFYFTGYSGTERLQLTSRRRRPFTLADFKRDKEVQPQVRKEFPDAIYWLGDLTTDAQGQAKVSIKYPDALTTWRLTARAITTDTRAGVSVVRTTTTKDLIVRVVTPRFLTEGDELVVPTIVHNYLSEPKDTAVTLSATGLTPAAPDATRASTTGVIANGAERRDDWRFAAPSPGTATISAAARTDNDADAVELLLPVLPYGLRREVGLSGSLSSDADHTTEVTMPSSANAAGRTIAVSLAPSMAGSLLGALDFLTSFPYGCTEQTLSSFLPNVLVTRALTDLKLVPTERLSTLDRQVSSGLRRLADLQHDDGGWGWWKTDDNHPFMTAYALFGLAEAKRAGYQVDEYRVSNGARALARMYATNPNMLPDLKAYVAYVLQRAQPDASMLGDDYSHSRALEELWSARDRMTAYGRALLLQTLDAAKDSRGNELAQTLAGEAETRGELTWWRAERDPLLLEEVDASVEATALALQALAARNPSDPQIDRAVRWLMLNRRGGYWWNTKQTAFALYGLLATLSAKHDTPQTFTVDVHVNDVLAGSHTFTPASFTSPDPVSFSVPAREGPNRVRLVKRGGGTLHWAARATYFDPQAAEVLRGSRRLAISRTYARVVPVKQRNGIVYREQPFDGRMSPGDVLSVRIVIAGSNDWRYLMVEDPLPAGVEAIQDTTAYPMERQDRWRWWWGSQTEYRDSRTVFFQERFDGRAEFIYLVKAISSGQFRAVPAQVSPMYVPDVNASSQPAVVTVGGGGTTP